MEYAQISTSMWSDSWFLNLGIKEKLLFTYLITNPKVNVAGVYELSDQYIAFETGLDITDIQSIIGGQFSESGKVFRIGKFIVITNYPKYRDWRTKNAIKIGIDNILSKLDLHTQSELVRIGYEYPLSEAPYYIGNNNIVQNEYMNPDDGGMNPDDGGMNPDDGGMNPDDGGIVGDKDNITRTISQGQYHNDKDNLSDISSLRSDISSSDGSDFTLTSGDSEIQESLEIPYEMIQRSYNQSCPSLPRCTAISDKRRKSIRACWVRYGDRMLEAFRLAEESDFLSGRSGEWPGCGFDWLMNSNNMLKVLEGNYKNGAKQKPARQQKYDPTSMDNWEGIEGGEITL